VLPILPAGGGSRLLRRDGDQVVSMVLVSFHDTVSIAYPSEKRNR
jgi:hypothetical protein